MWDKSRCLLGRTEVSTDRVYAIKPGLSKFFENPGRIRDISRDYCL